MRNGYKEIKKPRTGTSGRGKSKGTLFGIGIGPGDPQLLTLKAKEILRKADVIFAPKARIKSGSMAVDIIKSHIRKTDKVKQLLFPMTKDKKRLQSFWKRAALRVYKEISLGKNVAFVTVGDPFIYSTYIYLLRHIRKLDKQLKVVTVPGISAINAASALLTDTAITPRLWLASGCAGWDCKIARYKRSAS